jgi:hypothetical protein
MKRRYWWLGAIAAATLTIAGCSSGGDNTSTAAQPTAPAQSTPDQAQASAQAALRAEAVAADQAAKANVHSLEVRLQKERTTDDKLSLILTRYCQLGGGRYEDNLRNSTERLLLEDLFDKYWQAGGKWNRPIWSATQQRGACPAEFPTSPPSAGG